MVATAVAVLVACLVLLRSPFSADQFQPIRAMIAGVALGLAVLIVDPSRVRRVPRAYVLLAVAAVLVGASAFVNGASSALYGVQGRYMGLVAGATFLAAALAGTLAMRHHTRVLADALAAVGAVSGVWMVWERLAFGAAASGPSGNAVLSGGMCAIAACVAAAGAMTSAGTRRIALGVAALLAGAGAIASDSRGALLALLAGITVPLVVAARARSVRHVTTLAVAIAVVGIVAVTLNAAKLSASDLSSGSAGSRLEIWRGTSALVADHAALGVGPGRFLYEYPRYDTLRRVQLEPGDVRADQAHSELLQLCAEAGVPVGLLVAAFFLAAIVSGWRATSRKDGAAMIATTGLVAGAGYAVFGISTIEIGVVVWMLAGIALATGADDSVATGPTVRVWKAALLACAALLVVANSVFLVADAAYARGLAAFESGDLAIAGARFRRAVDVAPSVDVYRVALGDVALYGGEPDLSAVMATVDRGLEMEPDSYDLLAQRARLLKAAGATPAEVATAFVAALERFPRGVGAQSEAAQSLRAAGDIGQAEKIETALVEQTGGAR